MVYAIKTNEQIIEAITTAVRFLSIEQIARFWFAGSREDANEVLTELQQEQLVSIESHLVHPEIDLLQPQFRWMPSAELGRVPDFSAVAYRLREQWKQQKEMAELVFADPEACRRYGGASVRPRLSEFSHDLRLASVYLMKKPELARTGCHWISGDLLRANDQTAPFGGNIPDAAVINRGGEIEQLIEIGGSGYHREKLGSIHRSYARYSYEIW